MQLRDKDLIRVQRQCQPPAPSGISNPTFFYTGRVHSKAIPPSYFSPYAFLVNCLLSRSTYNRRDCRLPSEPTVSTKLNSLALSPMAFSARTVQPELSETTFRCPVILYPPIRLSGKVNKSVTPDGLCR